VCSELPWHRGSNFRGPWSRYLPAADDSALLHEVGWACLPARATLPCLRRGGMWGHSTCRLARIWPAAVRPQLMTAVARCCHDRCALSALCGGAGARQAGRGDSSASLNEKRASSPSTVASGESSPTSSSRAPRPPGAGESGCADGWPMARCGAPAPRACCMLPAIVATAWAAAASRWRMARSFQAGPPCSVRAPRDWRGDTVLVSSRPQSSAGLPSRCSMLDAEAGGRRARRSRRGVVGSRGR